MFNEREKMQKRPQSVVIGSLDALCINRYTSTLCPHSPTMKHPFIKQIREVLTLCYDSFECRSWFYYTDRCFYHFVH